MSNARFDDPRRGGFEISPEELAEKRAKYLASYEVAYTRLQHPQYATAFGSEDEERVRRNQHNELRNDRALREEVGAWIAKEEPLRAKRDHDEYLRSFEDAYRGVVHDDPEEARREAEKAEQLKQNPRLAVEVGMFLRNEYTDPMLTMARRYANAYHSLRHPDAQFNFRTREEKALFDEQVRDLQADPGLRKRVARLLDEDAHAQAQRKEPINREAPARTWEQDEARIGVILDNLLASATPEQRLQLQELLAERWHAAEALNKRG